MNLGDAIDSWGWGADIYSDNDYKTGYVSKKIFLNNEDPEKC
jgi:hypothetical protein